MNAQELIDILKEYPPDTLVVMSKDGEGNGFSPLDSHGDGFYVADSTYSGELFEDENEFAEYADEVDEAVKVIVLWPAN